ncbi:MAG: Hsp70 family protein [Myxococcales bacterium]|nr:Hsp70 family protein [Myxococcales bacterium]
MEDQRTGSTARLEGAIVGIDLGTTNSAIALFAEQGIRFFPNGLGESLTPSVVALDSRSSSLCVGRSAKDILAWKPGMAAAGFKRDIGFERKYSVGEMQLNPIELSAYVLDQLRTDAERSLGVTVERCVVTVPAYFNDAQRFATKQAAEMAGFTVERILNEPTAAAIAYGLHNRDSASTFLVIDLGGGTFDVCVMELFEGLLEVKSVAGESQLGGDDFTNRLAAALLEDLGLDVEGARMDAERFALLLKRTEVLKRKLSRWASAEVEVPAFRGLGQATRLSVSTDRADRAYAPLLDRMVGPCRAALRGAGLTSDALDEIVLVGGATRMPAVRRFAREMFGREPLTDNDPDLTVARGAAIQAALCGRSEAVGDIVVTDVCSHTLGVAVAMPVGRSHLEGYFSPLIHRNTVLPTSANAIYYPLDDRQSTVTLEIFQGESRLVKQNTFVGDLRVHGIPTGVGADQRGVRVTFTYDLDGILAVEAEILATGAVIQRVIRRRNGGLPAERADDLRERLAMLKRLASKPTLRERPKYRDLLARADLLWRESAGSDRRELAEAIARFELLLDVGDREAAESVSAALELLCEAIDGGERW